MDKHEDELKTQEFAFISSYLDTVEDPITYLYILMKIHKEPLMTRPIVSFPGSTFYALGVWVDTQLQQVAKSFDSYVESLFELFQDLKKLEIPPNCFLVTVDAKLMCTTIDIDAAISALETYLNIGFLLFLSLPLLKPSH